MRLRVIFAVLLVITLHGTVSAAEGPDENLIRKEMAALDKAFKITVDAVVLNQPEKIAPAFVEVQKIMEQVEQAVKDKKEIALPRNQNKFKVFVKLDNRFHREIGTLVIAAKKNRMRTVNRQTHNLLNMCVRCHAIFRKKA
ncbi:MAG: hypothetical protein WC855_04170 [Thermodesulfovibrionales bacterium]